MKTTASALSCFLARVALPLGLVAATFAQEATTPSYLPPAEEAVRLEKFEVSDRHEKTYVSQRSVTATKTDTALVNVPQSLSVVTRELIDDQSMRSIGDVTRYVPGAGIAQGEGNRDTPVLRGNSTTADFFVDGIRDDVQYFRDLYTVDRVEVLKGPNAMIFGRGGSGGLINRVTKHATGATIRELSLQVGSWDQYRATLDLGAPLTPTLAYRVTAVYEDAGSYRDDVTLNRYGINPTFAWRLAPHTTLHTGVEHFHDERTTDRGVSSFQGRPVKTDAATFFGDPAQSPTHATVDTAYAVLDHAFTRDITLRNSTRFSRYDKSYQNVFPGAVNAAVKQLEKIGAEIVEISLPHTDYAVAVYYIIATAEASANLARFDGIRYGHRCENPENLLDLYNRSRAEGFGPEVKRRIILGTYVLSSGYYDAYYRKAQKVRHLIRQDFARAFEKVDVLLGPTCPTPAFKFGAHTSDPLQMYLADIYTIAANLAGLCGLSLPCGQTVPTAGTPALPIGLQLLAPALGEATLLHAAHATEQALR